VEIRAEAAFEEAVKRRRSEGGDKPNAGQGHRSATMLHLATIAIRTGRASSITFWACITIPLPPVSLLLMSPQSVVGKATEPSDALWIIFRCAAKLAGLPIDRARCARDEIGNGKTGMLYKL
jgi:hypothetical protein